MNNKRILVIAGSDSSGGAGLEADQKVIAAHGCYAMTATTALTAQNTQGVYDIHRTPSSFVRKQIDACIEDIGVDVVKTGMLASASTIEVVAEALKRHNVPISIVDPVMVSTSGAQLLPEDAVEILITRLLPVTTLLTPNLPEAQLILKCAGRPVGDPQSVDDIVSMARAVRELGPKNVLLKGGHVPLTKDRVVPTGEADRQIVLNVLIGEGDDVIFETAYLKSSNTHGTGCSLASAIASRLASGMAIEQAVKTANYYIEAGIRTSQDLGKGSGPINHFHSMYFLPFAPGRFLEYLLDREDVKGPWREHTHHSFVQGLADGTLPLGKFKNYLIQDYLFLIQFSRANALAAYKAKNLADINKSARIVQHIQEEMGLHIKYCGGFGLTKEQIESHKEHPACTAYTRYVLDIGQSEDWFGLQIALMPCLIGYGHIARRLFDDPQTKREGNTYWNWVEQYVAEDYTDAVKAGLEIIEQHAVLQSPSRIEQLVQIFIHATKMETGFWDMGSL
ncbi:putative hydroxymethylpyrimidine/phosphomethylpyrimidine kinase 2 [Lasiodiplodia hormozganensis]|uniref:Hydroxymethylpyrimidine/phosphomethylpyrimidine kinase 2 n=1 Tax=Lasiodiplodia hormozganensis TaxID=869390 RepID=A0AA40D5Z1_9PEZI|nr:putative hydroxymethylpyrimidine/phosphomethylpyrimidine kinase 2 [Lasiodiplodia hormozganensis]